MLQRMGLLLLSHSSVRGKLLFLRSLFAAAGLHGIECSRFSLDNLRPVRFLDAVLCGVALILYFHVSLALPYLPMLVPQPITEASAILFKCTPWECTPRATRQHSLHLFLFTRYFCSQLCLSVSN